MVFLGDDDEFGSGSMGGITSPIVYLLRDEFLTNHAAPLPSPRTCEPGPGVLTIVDTGNKFTVASQALACSGGGSAAFNPVAYDATPRVRTPGLAVYCKFTPTSGSSRVGLSSNKTTFPDGGAILRSFLSVAFDESGTAVSLGPSLTAGQTYEVWMIARSAGYWCLIKGGTEYSAWTLVWVSPNGTQSPLYTVIWNFTGVFSADTLILRQLPAPWNGDYLPAISRVVNPVSGTALYQPPNAVIEFTWTPAAGETLELDVRRFDADNRWIIRCSQAGSTVKIIQRQAGGETERASNAQTFTVGTAYRIVSWQHGIEIRVNVANAPKGTYALASFNLLATETRVSGFATGSNFVVWPRLVSAP